MRKWVTCFWDIYVGTCVRFYLGKLLPHQILLVRWNSMNSLEFKPFNSFVWVLIIYHPIKYHFISLLRGTFPRLPGGRIINPAPWGHTYTNNVFSDSVREVYPWMVFITTLEGRNNKWRAEYCTGSVINQG